TSALTLGPSEVAVEVRYTPNGDLTIRLYQYKESEPRPGAASRKTISACLWNLASGERSPLIGIAEGPVAICPRDEGLASRSGDLWAVSTGKKLRTIKDEELSAPVFDIEFSPDGRTVLYRICDLGQNITILLLADVATGKKRVQIGEFNYDDLSRCPFLVSP